MQKKAISGMMLTVLILNVLTLALQIQPVKASGTIYIRANGSVDPPTAPIVNVGNHSYTFTADIYDSIVVERSNILVDGAGHTLQGTGSGNGFHWYGINNVTVRNTNIKSFEYGIWLSGSSNNTISGNTATANSVGIYVHASSNNNIVSGNTATANTLGGIALHDSSNNNIVSGNNATTNYDAHAGIALIGSSNNTISGNIATENGYGGIWLSGSSNNTISGNTATGNSGGIYVEDSSNNNIVSGNNAATNYNGIVLYFSSNNTVDENTATANTLGILLYLSSNSTVSGNNVTANTGHGISIRYSSNNMIIGNTATANPVGIYLSESSKNIIYHNNFVGNVEQVNRAESANVWDNGYPSGGNYWSDYAGIDWYKGPYQNETGSDGIGDTSYVIDSNNTDNYPLMHPYGSVRNLNTSQTYLTIQSAIDALETLDGHTIAVKRGTYSEYLVINKMVSLIGESRNNTRVGWGVTSEYNPPTIVIRSDNVSITQFDIFGLGSSGGGSTSLIAQGVQNLNVSNCFMLYGVGYRLTVRLLNCSNCVFTNDRIDGYVTISLADCYDIMFVRNEIMASEVCLTMSNCCNIFLMGNEMGGRPVGVFNSYNNTFCENSIGGEMLFENSNDNYLCRNTLGMISIHNSSSNIFVSNTISRERLGLYNSNMNSFYHNNISVPRVEVQNGTTIWDDGYPSGGNYWSDYDGVDFYNGPYQNETGSDGIGDTPYLIDSGNRDNYPFMEPYYEFDIAVTELIPFQTTVSHGGILSINATVESQGWSPATCDLTLSVTYKYTPSLRQVKLQASAAQGWNHSVPGPMIAAYSGDTLALTLQPVDSLHHKFYVDYNGNAFPDSNEPQSSDFIFTEIAFDFEADIVGSFTYYCAYHQNTEFGPLVVNPEPHWSTLVGSQEVTLAAHEKKNVTFMWNTIDFAMGNYIISAHAQPVLGEIDTADNTLVDGVVSVVSGPPYISNVIQIPLAPNCDDDVEVSAYISGDKAIDKALLSYTYASMWHNASMDGLGGRFNATIPAQPYETLVQYRIYANDTDGNWAVSELFSYTVDDFIAPEVILSRVPAYPLPGQKVKVFANVTEPANASGVKTPVFFSYRANGGPWWNTTMIFNAALGLYETTILGYEKHDLIEYFVKAVDNAGNINTTAIHHYEVLRCDVNHNGVVDVYDIYMIAKAWGSNLGSPNYVAEADIDENGIIGTQDLQLVKTQYGKDP